jgi:hypothetical protein
MKRGSRTFGRIMVGRSFSATGRIFHRSVVRAPERASGVVRPGPGSPHTSCIRQIRAFRCRTSGGGHLSRISRRNTCPVPRKLPNLALWDQGRRASAPPPVGPLGLPLRSGRRPGVRSSGPPRSSAVRRHLEQPGHLGQVPTPHREFKPTIVHPVDQHNIRADKPEPLPETPPPRRPR